MADPDTRVTYIGRTNHRNAGVLFGIRQKDRRSHTYICGKTGTGKSHLLRTMIVQDLAADIGCALIDPHGDLVREVRMIVPERRQEGLLYFDATDPNLNWRFNPFANVARANQSLACAGIIEVFKNLWADDWGPRLEHVFRNVVFTLLESPGSTFADIPRLLNDRGFRSARVAGLENDVVRGFWNEEYERYSPGFRSVVVAPLQNKIGVLLTDPMLRRLLTESGPVIDLRKAMDEGQVLLVNVDKGRIGEGPSALLGSLLLSHIALAGLSRSEEPQTNRRDFMVYLDEFQTFTTLSIATMLSELRKYGLGLIISHQHLSQLDPAIRDAVFGNVGTIAAFRVGGADASYLAREFAPVFDANDFISLPRFSIYIKVLVDGQPTRPFSAMTLDGDEAVLRSL